MTSFSYVWSCSVQIHVTNKKTDVSKTLPKTSYSTKMITKLQEGLKESFPRNDGLAYYVSNKYNKIVSSIIFTFDEVRKELKINVLTTVPLSKSDMKYVEDFISGQLSDGWGEGFEQIPFHETKTMNYQMFCLWKTLNLKTDMRKKT